VSTTTATELESTVALASAAATEAAKLALERADAT
jgi:hypothetical protein